MFKKTIKVIEGMKTKLLIFKKHFNILDYYIKRPNNF